MTPDPVEEWYGKRLLVEISHAIERFALAAPPDEPLVVIAMFQRLAYFEREAAMYQQIAARGAVTLVGVAEVLPPRMPPGVNHCLLSATEPLAGEWSVSVLGPRGGATLVAVDQERLDPAAYTLEEGRTFRGHWSFERRHAYREVLRLRSALRMPPELASQIEQVMHRVVAVPEPDRQVWWETPLRFLTDGMGRAMRERTAARHALERALDDTTERDPRTGLHTEKFLDRWTTGLGGGTLPIGLVLLRVSGLAELRDQYGLRAELAAMQGLVECTRTLLGDGDRMIRLAPEEILLVLPSWSAERVSGLCERVCRKIAALDEVYPFVPLPTSAAATVTRDRPLPVPRLRQQLDRGAPTAASATVSTG